MLELKKRLQDLFERCDIVEIADEYDEVIVDEYQNEIYFPVFGTVLFNDLDYNEYLKQSQKLISNVNSLVVKDIKLYKKLQFEIDRIFHLYHKEEFSDFYTHLNENISFVSKGITNNKTSEDFKKIGYDTLKILTNCIEDKISLSTFNVGNKVDIEKLVDNLIDLNIFNDSIEKSELKNLVLFQPTSFNFIIENYLYMFRILIDNLFSFGVWSKVPYTKVFKKYTFSKISENVIVPLKVKDMNSSYSTFINKNTEKEIERVKIEVEKCFVFN